MAEEAEASSAVLLKALPKGSPLGGAGERSETERARPLTARLRHSDRITLTEGRLIAVPVALP